MAKPPIRRSAKVTRVVDLEGRILSFTTPAYRRQRCPLEFLDKENVPDFDGAAAWFELERVTAVPWSYWKAIRQVEAPPDADERAKFRGAS